MVTSHSKRGPLKGSTNAADALAQLNSKRLPNEQVPAFYRTKLGRAPITILSDGPLPMGDPKDSFLGSSREDVGEMLRRQFLPTDEIVLAQNAPVVEIGGKLVIFDTGMGSLQQFGPTTGRLKECMLKSGIRAEDIDAVVCSHAHWDHVGGIWSDDNAPSFPNAQIYISELDYNYWTDEQKLGSELDGLVKAARKNLIPVRDRMVFFKDDQEFLTGIHAIASPGHTLGHHCFIIESEGHQLCYGGDLTHHPVLLFEKPQMEFLYDTDSKLSVKSRIRVLEMLAANQIPFMSYHFPWPGYGHVAKAGEGFRFFAEYLHLSLD